MSSFEQRSTTPTPTPTQKSTVQEQPSSAEKPKSRTKRQGRGAEAVAALPRTVRNQSPQLGVKPAVAAATAATSGSALLLAGLALFALVLASGSLLLLVTRAGTWKTRT